MLEHTQRRFNIPPTSTIDKQSKLKSGFALSTASANIYILSYRYIIDPVTLMGSLVNLAQPLFMTALLLSLILSPTPVNNDVLMSSTSCSAR